MRGCVRELAGAILVLMTLTGRARGDQDEANPYLNRARSEMAALQYGEAQELLAKALEHGGNGPEQLAEIYRMSAEVAAGLDQPKRAREQFERLLALRPRTSLPEGTSPKIALPFAEARAAADKRGPLRIRYRVRQSPTPAIVVTVESDPLGMVAGAVARCRVRSSPEMRVEGRGGQRMVLALPAGRPLDVIVLVLDRYGNQLVVHGSWEVPIRVPAPGTARPGPLPVYARWYLWGGVGVAFAAAGAYFGLATRSAQSDLDDLHRRSSQGEWISYDRAEAIETRGRRDALIANIAFAAAGVAAVTSLVLLPINLRRSHPGQAVVVPQLGATTGVAFQLRF